MPLRRSARAWHDAAPTAGDSMAKFQERVFSGVQPTGNLHLGNYLGAIKRFVELQDRYDCIYCVVDLHALTTGFEDVSRIHEDGIEMLADWIGAGVDPERSIVFRQSQVPEHSELALLLGSQGVGLDGAGGLRGEDRLAMGAG